MPTQVTITLYAFDELSDKAKERAREWYRSTGFDHDWWDFTYNDAKTIGGLFGLDIEEINFSGFWSQGDGARFRGSYRYKAGSVKAVTAYAPKDSTVQDIAKRLQDLQRKAGYRLTAKVEFSGHRYAHEHMTTIEVYKGDNDADPETEKAVTATLRDYMRWIYRQLESEWNHMTGDEQIDETIRANEYTFRENGERE